MTSDTTPVLIVGGGPVGLVLAIDLAWRGVPCMVVNTGETTALHPQGSTHNCRSMEHYRRLGIAEQVRATGLPQNDGTDVAYLTRFTDHELSRIHMPSPAEKKRQMAECDPSLLTPEPIHRASQFYVEPVLHEHAKKLPEIDLKFGWELTEFSEHADGVTSQIRNVATGETQTVESRWIVGCDGGQSHVRRALGISYKGDGGDEVAFMIGSMLSLYIDAPGLYDVMSCKPAYQFWTVNKDGRTCVVTLDGKGKFVVLAKFPDPDLDNDGIVAALQLAIGAEIDIEILSVKPWTAGNALVAERFGEGRAFLAGDAAHLFTPTGGFGMNTGIDDAANLAWKLAAAHHGWADEAILDTYEIERRPIGIRNTKTCRVLASDVATIEVPDELEDDTEAGAAARSRLGAHLAGFGEEFASLGIQLGARYDTSPLIVADGIEPPVGTPVDYVPTTCPGGRAPHLWLEDGTSTFDRFGKWFTLLKLGATDVDSQPLEDAAIAQSIPLSVVEIEEPAARTLYERDLVLVRPDGHVAWRGDVLPDDLADLFAKVVGTR
jgi:2-polyprenyl-6-methoxyphenol hydroxylase-like FAD-dependent oxidoreductase